MPSALVPVNMIKENSTPDLLFAVSPAGEEQAAGAACPAAPAPGEAATDLFLFPEPGGEETAAPAAAEGEGVPGAAAAKAAMVHRSPFYQLSRMSPENLESPFLIPQPAPIHWAVGWADLMMTMFVLFLVMYLYPSAKLAQFPQAGEQVQADKAGQQGTEGQGGAGRQGEGQGAGGRQAAGQGANELRKQEVGTMAGGSQPAAQPTAKLFDLTKLAKGDEEFARFAEINLRPDNTVRIILAGDLLFPSAKADLRLIAQENIRKISELLQETSYAVNVVGHTDDQPIRGGPFASNWELSVMRATTVARFLIEEMGVAASRVTVSGQSYFQPQVNNNTPANRAKNRRVEIIVSQEPPTLPVANSIPPPTPGEN